MYCPRCKNLTEYVTRKKADNKKLTLDQKKALKNML